MPLTVGELTGYLRLDDQQWNRTLTGAGRSLQRAADDITRTTERAGDQAGQALADGIGDGAEQAAQQAGQQVGGLVLTVRQVAADAAQALATTLTPAAARAGDQAGDAAADGIDRGIADAGDGARAELADDLEAAGRAGGEAAAEAIESELTAGAEDAGQEAGRGIVAGLGVAVAAGMVGVAAIAGKSLAAAMEQDKANDLLAVQIGASPAMAAEFGGIAGRLYAQAYGENLGEVNEALRAVWQQGLVDEDAATADIEKVAARALDLSEILQEDVGLVGAAVGTMLKTGMAANASEAFDILVRGVQQGANKSEDLLDTFNEYSTQFRRVGLDGRTAMGLISQALQNGARDADQVADAIGQFGERALAGGKPIEDAYKSIGLDADKMAAKIGKGGKSAEEALTLTLNALRGTKDEQVKLNAAAALFGDPANVMGAALDAMDPSKAAAGLGDLAGAADKAGKTLHDNASTNLESFKRQVEMAFVDTVGGKLLPIAEDAAKYLKTNFGPAFKAAVAWVKDDFIPAMKDAAKWIDENRVPIMVVAGLITFVLLPRLVQLGVAAMVSAGRQVAAWFATRAAATTSAAANVAAAWAIVFSWIRAAAAAIVHGAVIVARWVWMGVQATIQAARMAAAWLIAMGPIAWVTALIIGIAALIIYHWDTIKNATGAAWDWIAGKVAAAGAAIVGSVAWLAGAIVGAFVWMKDQSIAKGGELLDWFTGLPGRLAAGLASLGGLLWAKGWEGVSSLYNAATQRARDVQAWASGLPGQVRDWIGDLGGVLWNAGARLVGGFIDGIRSKINDIKSTLSSVTSMLPDWKGPADVDARILTPAGQLLIKGFQAGIDGQTPALRRQLGDLTGELPGMAGGIAVRPYAPPAPTLGQPQAVRVEFVFTGADGEFKRFIRKIVQADGRGSVQTAFGTL